ncbi:hypothetical protein ScPMuIL_014981 [Solemya velum]
MARRRPGCFRPGRVAFYYCLSFVVLVLVVNIVILHHGFTEMEAGGAMSPEEASDINALDENGQLRLKIVNEVGQYNILERRHRKLMVNAVENYDDGITEGSHFTSPLLNCHDIANLSDLVYLASGWTKAVYRGNFKGRAVAIKIVDTSGQDVTTCTKNGMLFETCLEKASQKILKEISILQALPHDNVIKVLGFCVPDQEVGITRHSKVAMVTELGESVDLIKLLQMSWEDRLRISLDITNLIKFLGDTPYGSMAMNDFRRQQFVVVNGQLKLSDVDDAGFGDPSCSHDEECSLQCSSSNFTYRMPCILGICRGFNKKRNTYNAGRHFTTFLLPHGAPSSLRPLVDKIVSGYSSLDRSQETLADELEEVVLLYKTGWYLGSDTERNKKTEYAVYENRDLPGMFDYRCRFSISGSGCTVSVFDRKEAEELCDKDPECSGFVLSSQRTWTGRIVIHLKNGFKEPTRSTHTHLYIKPSLVTNSSH